MPTVSFDHIELGHSYSRQALARLWGYRGIQALARGIVTARGERHIILFITREKQPSQEQYEDVLEDGHLRCEGPTDHYAEDRMIRAEQTGDENYLFYRDRHHSDFTYCGRLRVESVIRHTDRPSRFVFRLIDL